MYAKIGIWTTSKQDTKFKTLVNQIIKQTEYLFHIWYSEFYSYLWPFDPEAIKNFLVNMYAKIGIWTTSKQDTKFKTLVNQIIKQTEYLFHIWYSEFYS